MGAQADYLGRIIPIHRSSNPMIEVMHPVRLGPVPDGQCVAVLYRSGDRLKLGRLYHCSSYRPGVQKYRLPELTLHGAICSGGPAPRSAAILPVEGAHNGSGNRHIAG